MCFDAIMFFLLKIMHFCTFEFAAVPVGSGETLLRYFSGTVDLGTEMSSWCLLSAFLMWYNVPHPNTLAQMGLTGELMSAYL